MAFAAYVALHVENDTRKRGVLRSVAKPQLPGADNGAASRLKGALQLAEPGWVDDEISIGAGKKRVLYKKGDPGMFLVIPAMTAEAGKAAIQAEQAAHAEQAEAQAEA